MSANDPSKEAAKAVEDVIALLKKRLEVFQAEPKIKQFSGGTFKAWATSIETILVRGFGNAGTRLLTVWRNATFGLPMPASIVLAGAYEPQYRDRFENALPNVEATLSNIIEELETFGMPQEEVEARLSGERPRALIAHGGRPPALSYLREFLIALGVEPLIVEDLPSQGRSVDQNVDFYLNQADCGIVLAMADDLVDGKFQPRGNVLDEHGRLRQKFPDRVIYLLEEGANLPSNIDEKLWERFTQDNMQKAFVKLARELNAFGILKAVKPIP